MKIAIKANPDRGEEIISLLESLGGNNIRWEGDATTRTYYIDINNMIRYGDAPKDYKVYTLEEFETQFPFKVGDLCIYSSDILDEDIVVRVLGMTMTTDCVMYEVGHRSITKKHSYIYRKRETLRPYKEMKEERNVTLTLDKAKEWYKKGGELKEVALQAFSEKELTKVRLPKTWKEFCDNYPVQEEYWLGSCDQILRNDSEEERTFRNWIPSKKSAEAHLALIQLEQLRDCWRKGWIPDYTKTYKKFRIKKLGTEYIVDWSTGLSDFLVFQTEELAKEFLECFRDLIEKAGDLI